MLRATAAASVFVTLVVSACAQTAVQPTSSAVPQKELRSPDVLFVPTPDDVVEAMLNVASVGQGDVLYDLGSGDGRIPITAAQHYGIARGVGIDINPKRVKEANENRISAGVQARVTFINADLFESDFSDATVVTLYQRERGQNRPQADARKRRSGAPNLRRRDRGLGTRNEEAKD